MKKIQKIALIFLIGIVAAFTAINYIYLQITPRTFGESTFPLNEKWSLCVDENIRDISTDGNGIVLVKTNTSLSAYNKNTGFLMWKSPIKSQRETFPPIVANKKVFVSDSENLWAFELKTGKVLWKEPIVSTDTWVPYASDKFVLLNSISDRVYTYDATSGDKLWEISGGRGYTQAYIDDDKVYIVDRGIKALDAYTGKLIWQLDNNRVTGESAFEDGIIYYIEYPGDNAYDLVAYNTEIRREVWRINFTDYGTDTLSYGLYIHDNFLFLTQLGFVYRINLENGAIIWKRKFSNPEDLSVISKNTYVLTPFEEIIHSLNIESGIDTGSLQISFYKLIITGTYSQKMTSTGTNLVFARGCEVFVYGK